MLPSSSSKDGGDRDAEAWCLLPQGKMQALQAAGLLDGDFVAVEQWGFQGFAVPRTLLGPMADKAMPLEPDVLKNVRAQMEAKPAAKKQRVADGDAPNAGLDVKAEPKAEPKAEREVKAEPKAKAASSSASVAPASVPPRRRRGGQDDSEEEDDDEDYEPEPRRPRGRSKARGKGKAKAKAADRGRLGLPRLCMYAKANIARAKSMLEDFPDLPPATLRRECLKPFESHIRDMSYRLETLEGRDLMAEDQSLPGDLTKYMLVLSGTVTVLSEVLTFWKDGCAKTALAGITAAVRAVKEGPGGSAWGDGQHLPAFVNEEIKRLQIREYAAQRDYVRILLLIGNRDLDKCVPPKVPANERQNHQNAVQDRLLEQALKTMNEGITTETALEETVRGVCRDLCPELAHRTLKVCASMSSDGFELAPAAVQKEQPPQETGLHKELCLLLRRLAAPVFFKFFPASVVAEGVDMYGNLHCPSLPKALFCNQLYKERVREAKEWLEAARATEQFVAAAQAPSAACKDAARACVGLRAACEGGAFAEALAALRSYFASSIPVLAQMGAFAKTLTELAAMPPEHSSPERTALQREERMVTQMIADLRDLVVCYAVAEFKASTGEDTCECKCSHLEATYNAISGVEDHFFKLPPAFVQAAGGEALYQFVGYACYLRYLHLQKFANTSQPLQKDLRSTHETFEAWEETQEEALAWFTPGASVAGEASPLFAGGGHYQLVHCGDPRKRQSSTQGENGAPGSGLLRFLCAAVGGRRVLARWPPLVLSTRLRGSQLPTSHPEFHGRLGGVLGRRGAQGTRLSTAFGADGHRAERR